MKTDRVASEAQIRSLIEDRVKAIRNKDIDALVRNFSPDVVSFDVVNPLLSTGIESIRNRLEQWFSSFLGPIGFEMRDLIILAGDEVAFCHGLSGVDGTRVDGGKLRMWYRTTICYRKTGGRWMIAHEHDSVPFDPQTGRPSLDLMP